VVGRALLLVTAAVILATAPAVAAEAPFTLDRSVVTGVATPTGRHYRVLVAWPDGPPPATGWPVLYVLDGDDNFAATVSTARRLARAGARSGVEPGVVVGIASEDLARRVLDYTPPAPGYAIPTGAPASGLATGGGDAFLDVMRDRIQPEIARRLKIDPNRQTILGHSFGGLLVLHALSARPNQFQTYVAISPSLWFGDGAVARQLSGAKPRANVLIAAGDREGGPASAVPNFPTAQSLAETLKISGVQARFLPLPGQSHGGTMYASLAEAVALAFRHEGVR
jgi:predicted alpha/beta superfamily hydrolase